MGAAAGEFADWRSVSIRAIWMSAKKSTWFEDCVRGQEADHVRSNHVQLTCCNRVSLFWCWQEHSNCCHCRPRMMYRKPYILEVPETLHHTWKVILFVGGSRPHKKLKLPSSSAALLLKKKLDSIIGKSFSVSSSSDKAIRTGVSDYFTLAIIHQHVTAELIFLLSSASDLFWILYMYVCICMLLVWDRSHFVSFDQIASKPKWTVDHVGSVQFGSDEMRSHEMRWGAWYECSDF